MRLALAFRRFDVDQFLHEIDADQFEEWTAFLQLEPQGWQAISMAITRLSYITAQSHSAKKLKERDYELKLGGGGHSAAGERMRWEAMSIRTAIAEGTFEERN